MEHSWGQNVRFFGLGGTGCTLCACYDESPARYLVVTNEKLVGESRHWHVPKHTLLPDGVYVEFTGGMFTPHFPYGYPVPPDVPL